MTAEYAEKNAIKRPWGDILYKNLQPKSKSEAITQGFYPCMVRGPQPENADPSSLLWCRDDNLFKRNYKFAKDSAVKNKKAFGLDFNPGPSAPRADGTRDANPNVAGPFYNLEGLITHITVQGAVVDHSLMMEILMKRQLHLSAKAKQNKGFKALCHTKSFACEAIGLCTS